MNEMLKFEDNSFKISDLFNKKLRIVKKRQQFYDKNNKNKYFSEHFPKMIPFFFLKHKTKGSNSARIQLNESERANVLKWERNKFNLSEISIFRKSTRITRKPKSPVI